MAQSFSPTTLRSIDVQFDKIAEDVKDKMEEVLENAAKICLFHVINYEGKDPFKTGSYISSHRVGINKVDTSDTVIKDVGIITIAKAKSNAMKEMDKIKNIKLDDTITISNSVGYSTKNGYSWAGKVEYSGWPNSSVKPYLVYEKAVAKTMIALPGIASTIKDKKV